MLSLFIIFTKWFKPTEDKSAYFNSKEYREEYPHGFHPLGKYESLILTGVAFGFIFLQLFLMFIFYILIGGTL